jgi:hypothetical protein
LSSGTEEQEEMRGILRKLFGRSEDKPVETQKGVSANGPEEHALIVETKGVQVEDGALYAVEDALTGAIEKAGVGIYDGHDRAVDGSHAILYMYGPDADDLFKVALPILLSHALTASGVAKRRYGSAQNPNAQVKFTSLSDAQP